METTRLYHNPRCSKSRGALELLRGRGIEPVVVEYLQTPPTTAEIRQLLALLQIPARALLRTGEAEYAQLGLADESLHDDQLIEAMSEHPRLIERPIFLHDGRAVIARPPERVYELLD